MILVLGIVLCLLLQCSASPRTCTNPDNFKFLRRNEQILSDGVIERIPDRGLVQCALECMLRAKCKSVSFEHGSGFCSLFEDVIEHLEVTSQQGTDISNIQDWPSRLAGPCENHDCSIYEVCQIINRTLNLKTCIVTHCPHPPTVENATENFVTNFDTTRVGSQLSYTCDLYFVAVGLRTCQLNGTWSDFRCEANCFRNVNQTVVYSGKQTTTAWGLTCQRWDSQSPHDHSMTNPNLFPDESLSAAENFCRDPYHYGHLWCFTTDPHIYWKICDVPECPDQNICPPSSFVDVNNHACYKIVNDGLSWEDARGACQADNGDLLNEQTNGGSYMAIGIVRYDVDYWIGLRRVEDDWKWTDGTHTNYYWWGDNEPKSSETGTCVMRRNYQVYTEDCGRKIGYICRINTVRCVAPPVIEHATANFNLSTAQRTTGTSLNYTCQENYVGVGETKCQPNGTWSTVTCVIR